jgi:aminomethyltransferase
MSLKRTPLYAAHQKAGARLIEFGGWEMPVQYSSIVDEHQCVRRAAGIFDISHMGEVHLTGPEAAAFLNQILTNDIRKLGPGLGQYTLMCNERGGVVYDLYVFCLAPAEYLLIINASRIEPDVAWLASQLAAFPRKAGVRMVNQSDATGAVAVQGPRVAQFMDDCVTGPAAGGAAVAQPTELKKNQIARFSFLGQPIWVSRTGYTGEDGFEIMAPAGLIEAVWQKCLATGHIGCLQPAGLGARDTLRTEACYPLYGHELDENTTPIEAGLKYFVALDKGDFTGRSVLAAQAAQGVARKCIAFKMTGRSAPPRPGYAIWAPDGTAACGTVVSGTQSPTLGLGIGLGYVPPALATPGTPILIEIRGQRYPAGVVARPFYRPGISQPK